MATIGSAHQTFSDVAKRLDPGGKVDNIAEVFTEVNEMLMDAHVIEGNTQTGHRTTLRTGLPTVAWRQINQGVQPSKSSTRQIDFTAGMIEAMGQIDEELLAMIEDKGGYRLSENRPTLEAISQLLQDTMLYGDVRLNPERFTGLAAYYSALTGADSSAYVVNGGGDTVSGQTSLWLVVWGEQSVHLFYPKGSQAGIFHEDKGKVLIEDGITTGSKYWAVIDQYKAKMGLCVRDYRQIVRVANLDVADLDTADTEADTSANLIKLAIKAQNKVWNLKAGRAAWYCNKTVKTALDIKAMSKPNAQINIQTLQDGSPMTRLLGLPVRRVDAILDTESVVA